MDNIQKLVLGVLSVAGLLAFLTPTAMDSQPPDAEPAVAAADPSLAPVMEAPMPEFDDEEIIEEGEEPFKFGEPTIDGKPFGESGESESGESPDQPVAPGNMAQNYEMPGMQTSYPQIAMPEGTAIIQPDVMATRPVIQQNMIQ